MSSDDFSQFVTIVSGLPRSGTSLMMAMLQAGGIPLLTDYIREADEDNKRGYFEYEPVKTLGSDASWVTGARGKAVKIIAALLQHLPATCDYRVIYMERNLEEVIASQRTMLERSGKRGGRITPAQLRALYEGQNRKVQEWLDAQQNMETLAVSYNELLAQPESIVRQISSFLGDALDEATMLSVIDPSLYRQRRQAAGGSRPGEVQHERH